VLNVSNTTATTSTTTGSIVTPGGIGAGGSMWLGGSNGLILASGGSTYGQLWATATRMALEGRNGALVSFATGGTTRASIDSGGRFLVSGNGSVTVGTTTGRGALDVLDSTAATSSVTGAIVTTGGLGVGGNSNFGANVTIQGQAVVSNSTASSSSTSGALQVTGGAGIGVNIYVGVNAAITGTLTSNTGLNVYGGNGLLAGSNVSTPRTATVVTTAGMIVQTGLVCQTNAVLPRGWITLGSPLPLSSSTYKFGSKSLDLTGTAGTLGSSYISLPNFWPSMNTGSWTLEFWLYHTCTATSSFPNIVSTGLSAIMVRARDTNLLISLASAGSYDIANAVASPALTANAWNHVALIFDGSAYYCYVHNGTSSSRTTIATSSLTLNIITSTVTYGYWAIGTSNNGKGQIGYIDDFRLSNTVRYSTASSSHTPPASQLSWDSSTVTLNNFEAADCVSGAQCNFGLVVGSGLPATSSTSAALAVTGGAGVTGDVYIGGSSTVTGNLTVVGSLTMSNPLSAASGGLGLNTAATASGAIPYTSSTGTWSTLAKGTDGYVLTLVSGLPAWQAAASGSNLSSLYVSGNTDATSASTGSITTAGGIGVAKSVYVGNQLTVGGASYFFASTASTSSTTGAVTVTGGLGIGGNSYFGGSLNVSSTSTNSTLLTVSGTYDPTSTTTGAVTVSGGVGVGKSVYAGGQVTATKQITTGGVARASVGLAGDSQPWVVSGTTSEITIASGAITFLGTTDNTSTLAVPDMSALLTPSSSFTLEFTFTLLSSNQTTYAGTILGHTSANTFRLYTTRSAGTSFDLSIAVGDGSSIFASNTVSPMYVNSPYTVVVAYNASSGSWAGWLTGVQVFSDGSVTGHACPANFFSGLIFRSNAGTLNGDKNFVINGFRIRSGVPYGTASGSLSPATVPYSAGATNVYLCNNFDYPFTTASASSFINSSEIGYSSLKWTSSGVQVTSSTAATSSTSGALSVVGGISTQAGSYFGGSLYVANTTDSTLTTTGAMTVSGGLGIGKSVCIGGTLSVLTNALVNGNTIVSGNTILQGLVASSSTSTNATTFSVAGTCDSTSTNTGAMTTLGGFGIAKSVFVGNNASVLGTLGVNGPGPSWYIYNTGTAPSYDVNNRLLFNGSASSAANMNYLQFPNLAQVGLTTTSSFTIEVTYQALNSGNYAGTILGCLSSDYVINIATTGNPRTSGVSISLGNGSSWAIANAVSATGVNAVNLIIQYDAGVNPAKWSVYVNNTTSSVAYNSTNIAAPAALLTSLVFHQNGPLSTTCNGDQWIRMHAVRITSGLVYPQSGSGPYTIPGYDTPPYQALTNTVVLNNFDNTNANLSAITRTLVAEQAYMTSTAGISTSAPLVNYQTAVASSTITGAIQAYGGISTRNNLYVAGNVRIGGSATQLTGAWTSSATPRGLSSTQAKYGTKSLDMSASANYVATPDVTGTISSGAWTLEFFHYQTSSATCTYIGSTSASTDNICIEMRGASNLIYFGLSSNGSTFDIYNSTFGQNVTVNQWAHCAVTFDGTNSYSFWYNGGQAQTFTSSSKIKSLSGIRLANNNAVTAYLDGFRLSSVARYSFAFTSYAGSLPKPVPDQYTITINSFEGTDAISSAESGYYVSTNTASSSCTTGALTVSGGIGATGNAYVGGNLVIPTGQLIMGQGSGSNLVLSGGITTSQTTAATNTTTGALQVAGGISSKADVWAGGSFFTSDTGGTGATIKICATGGATYIESGASTTGGSAAPINFTSMNASATWMTLTSTDLWLNTANLHVSSGGTNYGWLHCDTTRICLEGQNSSKVSLAAGGAEYLEVTTAGVVRVIASTNSSSTTSGAFQCNGGIGVQGNGYFYGGLNVGPNGTASQFASMTNLNGGAALSDAWLRLRTSSDNNHYVGYVGGSIDGPKIAGNSSVVFATTANGDRLLCNSSGVTYYGGLTNGSDRRIKDNIISLDLDHCKSFIAVANPVSFTFKSGDGIPTYGFIAQEVRDAGFTDLVKETPYSAMDIEDDGSSAPGTVLTMSYTSITPILTKVVQSILVENAALKQQVNDQQAQITALQAKLDALISVLGVTL
jgi:hypothetical protein